MAMAGITVVTDSTAYMPPSLVARLGIELISLRFTFGGENGSVRELDVGDLGEFYDRLAAAETLPITQPPLLEECTDLYRRLVADGGSVVSVHISSGLSETCSVARKAAAGLGADGERVHILDSVATSGQLGLLALAAAQTASAGGSVEEVVDTVRQARLESRLYWLLDTLDYLRRGGRIGSAAAWIGSTLNIKPILTLESEIKAVERVRTRERGLERLVDLSRQLQAAGATAYFVTHTRCPDDARALVERLQEVFWRPPEFVEELGPVVGTHTGPGLLGCGGLPVRFLE
ncbi:MAG TPA: DegV family protein [Thermoleophilaceae bacterium]|nr:DegV family protein [Thermoleophilaceae bacterium]